MHILVMHQGGIDMSRTTLDIDAELLAKAMEASGAKTKTEAVELALGELVRQRQLKLLREELGTFDLDLDLEKLQRDRRARDERHERMRRSE